MVEEYKDRLSGKTFNDFDTYKKYIEDEGISGIIRATCTKFTNKNKDVISEYAEILVDASTIQLIKVLNEKYMEEALRELANYDYEQDEDDEEDENKTETNQRTPGIRGLLQRMGSAIRNFYYYIKHSLS